MMRLVLIVMLHTKSIAVIRLQNNALQKVCSFYVDDLILKPSVRTGFLFDPYQPMDMMESITMPINWIVQPI